MMFHVHHQQTALVDSCSVQHDMSCTCVSSSLITAPCHSTGQKPGRCVVYVSQASKHYFTVLHGKTTLHERAWFEAQVYTALPAAGAQPSHSPNISLGHNFGSSGQSLLDDTDAESSTADEEEVHMSACHFTAHQVLCMLSSSRTFGLATFVHFSTISKMRQSEEVQVHPDQVSHVNVACRCHNS